MMVNLEQPFLALQVKLDMTNQVYARSVKAYEVQVDSVDKSNGQQSFEVVEQTPVVEKPLEIDQEMEQEK